MRQKKLKLSIILLLGLGLTDLKAQESIASSGGEAIGNGGLASYSVGQIVYTTNVGTNGSVAQGVQQPFEISVVAEIEETKDIILLCSVYPNPTTNYVKLKLENNKTKNLIYRLYDINGKILEYGKIENNETSILISNLVPASYFLIVFQGEKEIKTFKIIKN